MAHTKSRPRAPARKAALATIARRMLSEAELRERLTRKGYDEGDVEDAIQLVCSYGYVDDAALACAVAREAERTGRGPCWVRQTLARRGVAENLWGVALERLDQKAVAHRLLTHRFGEPEHLEGRARQRACRWLLGRGFSFDCVTQLLGDA